MDSKPFASFLPESLSLPTRESAVVVRPFLPTDAQLMHEAAMESQTSLRTWMTWFTPDFSINAAEAFVVKASRDWAHGEQFNFAIVDKKDGDFLGSVGLNHINTTHQLANIGYWVRQSAAGRGIATTSVESVVRFALGELAFQRVEFLIPTINVASQRVAQKVGAKLEGVLRGRLTIEDRCHDAALYALTQEDLTAA